MCINLQMLFHALQQHTYRKFTEYEANIVIFILNGEYIQIFAE